MKTISVLSRKGGAGKTTVSASLAVAAQQAGLKTVLADIDPMRSAAVVFAGREDGPSLLLETIAAKVRAVQHVCKMQGCDLLIFDTPPAPEKDVLRAIEISDLCLAIARPSALDLAALAETIRLISSRRRDGLIVLNQCSPTRGGVEAALTRAAEQKLEFAGLPVARTKLRSRVAYQHAAGQNRGVTEWSPASSAAMDVLCLLAEVSERLSPGGQAVPTLEPYFTPRNGRPGSLDTGHAPVTAASAGYDESWATCTTGLAGMTAGGLWGGLLEM